MTVPAASRPANTPAGSEVSQEVACRPDEASVSRLVVGPNIKLKGVEINDCDTLVVEGRVEAAVKTRTIQIAERGSFVGEADADVAEIRGAFEGNLSVRGRLVVHATGRISGMIRYGQLLVQEGGEIAGDVGTSSVPAGVEEA
jgi:cytoskeletal protein CcmA (bactofilin family)